jgi:hypothetical protein
LEEGSNSEQKLNENSWNQTAFELGPNLLEVQTCLEISNKFSEIVICLDLPECEFRLA